MGGNMGVIVAVQDPPGDPVITSISTVNWKDGTTGIIFTGTNFGIVEGSVNVSVQGAKENDTISIAQTVTAWTDTSITITAVIPVNGSVDWPGYYDASASHILGTKSNTIQVLIGPNQTVVGVEHASGLAHIDAGVPHVPQTQIDLEAAGTFYLVEGTFIEKSIQPQAADQYIGHVGGCKFDGSKAVTGFTVSGSNWVATGQTQSDTNQSANTRSWHDDNIGQADFFIALDSQNQDHMVRIRRYNAEAANASADSSATLGANPFTTHFGELKFRDNLVSVADTNPPEHGEAVYFQGADAGGGITIDGFYTVIEDNSDGYLIEHESDATSASAGGGSSVTRVKGIGVFFDNANNQVFLNIDPTGTPTINVRASTTDLCFDLRTTAVDDVVVRGASNAAKLQILRYADITHLGGGICLRVSGGGQSDRFTGVNLNIHHLHSTGIQILGDDHKFYDCITSFMGQHGIMAIKEFDVRTDNLSYYRMVADYNNTADYSGGSSAGIKLLQTTNVVGDQITCGRNRAVGYWHDTKCSIKSGAGNGLKRLHSYFNGGSQVFMEGADYAAFGGAGDSVISNSLVQVRSFSSTSFNGVRPAGFLVIRNLGTSTQATVIRTSVVEAYEDHPDLGPMMMIGLGVSGQGPDAKFMRIEDNLCVVVGSARGVGRSGFMSLGAATAARTTTMKDNTTWTGNTYHHPSASTVKVYGNATSPSTNTTQTLAVWQDEDPDFDNDVIYNFDDSDPPLNTSRWGAIPTWPPDGIIALSV